MFHVLCLLLEKNSIIIPFPKSRGTYYICDHKTPLHRPFYVSMVVWSSISRNIYNFKWNWIKKVDKSCWCFLGTQYVLRDQSVYYDKENLTSLDNHHDFEDAFRYHILATSLSIYYKDEKIADWKKKWKTTVWIWDI